MLNNVLFFKNYVMFLLNVVIFWFLDHAGFCSKHPLFLFMFFIYLQTIGQAYEDMQTQNQHLLQQVAERDDYNIKVCIVVICLNCLVNYSV